MARYFVDTSALTKLYVREPGTDVMLRLANEEGERQFSLLAITAVEFRSAVRRRQRAGDIEAASAEGILAAFASHLEFWFVRQPLTEYVLETALRLVDRHALRAYDALQLGGCIVHKATSSAEDVIFICADNALNQAAANEGLQVINPEIVSQ